ncbi:MFS transporter [Chitinimonas koreensis]|uniref:MFS transporter n=1 Tax=Chitinimonas koreensis TaxID=356302 RepID=UPI000A0432AF|nr:MFS transporter [Chitinimonas koreensis]QNM97925.1 MFS transporter [Chitinimonas koreensis]
MSDLPLHRNRPFMLLWLGSVASSFGLAIAMLSETWYAVNVLHLRAELGYVMLAGTLPRIALMALGGVLADRLPRSRIMAASFLTRALLLAAMGTAAHLGVLTLPLLIALAAGFGMLDALFWPARDAILPALLQGSLLGRANAWLLATNQLGMVAGPVLGGILLAALPFAGVFGLTAATMAAGALACLAVAEPPRSARARRAIWAELKEGFACVRDTPALRLLLIIYALANLLFAGPNSFAPPLIAATLPGASAGLLAQLQSAFAAGMLSGGVLLAIWPPRHRRLRLICWLIAIEGLLLAALPQLGAVAATAVQYAIGLCIACNNVPMLALLQQHTPAERIGRVMSLNSMASMGLTPVAYALTSLLLSAGASLGTVAACCGVLLALLCTAIALGSKTARTID